MQGKAACLLGLEPPGTGTDLNAAGREGTTELGFGAGPGFTGDCPSLPCSHGVAKTRTIETLTVKEGEHGGRASEPDTLESITIQVTVPRQEHDGTIGARPG